MLLYLQILIENPLDISIALVPYYKLNKIWVTHVGASGVAHRETHFVSPRANLVKSEGVLMLCKSRARTEQKLYMCA